MSLFRRNTTPSSTTNQNAIINKSSREKASEARELIEDNYNFTPEDRAAAFAELAIPIEDLATWIGFLEVDQYDLIIFQAILNRADLDIATIDLIANLDPAWSEQAKQAEVILKQALTTARAALNS